MEMKKLAKKTYCFKASAEEMVIIDKNAEDVHMTRSQFVVYQAINNINYDSKIKGEVLKVGCQLSSEVNKLRLKNPELDLSKIEEGIEKIWQILK
jgi:hypothetical protein